MVSKVTKTRLVQILVCINIVCMSLLLLLLMQTYSMENFSALFRNSIGLIASIVTIVLTIFKAGNLAVVLTSFVLLITSQTTFLSIAKNVQHDSIFLVITSILYIVNLFCVIFIKVKKKKIKNIGMMRSIILGLILGCVLTNLFYVLKLNFGYPVRELLFAFLLFLLSIFVPYKYSN